MRLFDCSNKLASSFRPEQGLPESEKSRIANRYSPVFQPLSQAIQAAINDLEAMAAHRAREAELVLAIAETAQELAVRKRRPKHYGFLRKPRSATKRDLAKGLSKI